VRITGGIREVVAVALAVRTDVNVGVRVLVGGGVCVADRVAVFEVDRVNVSCDIDRVDIRVREMRTREAVGVAVNEREAVALECDSE
jgi:hypothetical protein